MKKVSVPFTSGSSLQRVGAVCLAQKVRRFSSLYIGILAATYWLCWVRRLRCVSVPFTSGSSLQQFAELQFDKLELQFQFPLHRDPRCNLSTSFQPIFRSVSVPFTSGSSLQLGKLLAETTAVLMFQFPLHRDPRCNILMMMGITSQYGFSSLYIGILAATWKYFRNGCWNKVSVPFTSGSSLQRALQSLICKKFICVSVPFTSGSSLQQFSKCCNYYRWSFSSLYIGILAATNFGNKNSRHGSSVSVPFTSGSSLQPEAEKAVKDFLEVSVPFTSGSSLQRDIHVCMQVH